MIASRNHYPSGGREVSYKVGNSLGRRGCRAGHLTATAVRENGHSLSATDPIRPAAPGASRRAHSPSRRGYEVRVATTSGRERRA